MYNPADPNTEYIELTNIGRRDDRSEPGAIHEWSELRLPAVRAGLRRPLCGRQDVARLRPNTGRACHARAGMMEASAMPANTSSFRMPPENPFRPSRTPTTGVMPPTARLFPDGQEPCRADPNALSSPDAWRPSAKTGGSPELTMVQASWSLAASLSMSCWPIPPAETATGSSCTTRPSTPWISAAGTSATTPATPPSTRLPPGPSPAARLLVLAADDHFGNVADPGCHTSFALSQDGETLCLYSASQGVLTGYSERVEFGASESGVTFGRHALSTGTYDFVRQIEPTPGGPNAGPQVGPVVISEIMYAPDYLPTAEYIELVNAGDAPVTLYDAAADSPWRLAKSGTTPPSTYSFRVTRDHTGARRVSAPYRRPADVPGAIHSAGGLPCCRMGLRPAQRCGRHDYSQSAGTGRR